MCGRISCHMCKPDYRKAASFYDSVQGRHVQPDWIDASNGGLAYTPSTNIAPTEVLPVVIAREHHSSSNELSRRVIKPMIWGMIPPWHKGNYKSHGLTTNNCRLENVQESRLYGKPLRSGQRCAVAVQGFYEWQTTKGKGHPRQPYFVKAPQDPKKPSLVVCSRQDNILGLEWPWPAVGESNTLMTLMRSSHSSSELLSSRQIGSLNRISRSPVAHHILQSAGSSSGLSGDSSTSPVSRQPTMYSTAGPSGTMTFRRRWMRRADSQEREAASTDSQRGATPKPLPPMPRVLRDISNTQAVHEVPSVQPEPERSASRAEPQQQQIDHASEKHVKAGAVEETSSWELAAWDEKLGWAGPRLLLMAGLFDSWTSPQGDELFSFTIITMESNESFAWLHHRVPAILDSEELVDNWLDHGSCVGVAALRLLQPVSCLTWHPVSTQVNNSRHKDSSCNKPIDLKKPAVASKLMESWLKRGASSQDAQTAKKSKQT